LSRCERERWQAILDADPALRAAWEDFRAQLARSSSQLGNGNPDIEAVCRAMNEIFASAGNDKTRH